MEPARDAPPIFTDDSGRRARRVRRLMRATYALAVVIGVVAVGSMVVPISLPGVDGPLPLPWRGDGVVGDARPPATQPARQRPATVRASGSQPVPGQPFGYIAPSAVPAAAAGRSSVQPVASPTSQGTSSAQPGATRAGTSSAQPQPTPPPPSSSEATASSHGRSRSTQGTTHPSHPPHPSNSPSSAKKSG